MTTLGSIQLSMLDYDAFQAQNGGGWYPCTAVDLSGTDLNTLTGLEKTPDLRRKFFRNVGGNAVEPFVNQEAATAPNGATFQYDDVPVNLNDTHSHQLGGKGDTEAGKYPDVDIRPNELNALRHYWNSPNTNKSYVWTGTKEEGSVVAKTTQETWTFRWNTDNLDINLTGGIETKPKEMTVFFYMRVRNMPEDGNPLPPEVLE